MGTAALPLAIAGAQAGAGLFGAAERNRATKRSMRVAREGADLQVGQLNEAADLERRKRETEAHLVRSRLRVLAADAGLDFEGSSFADYSEQADRDEAISLAIIERNRYNQTRRVLSGLGADLTQLSANVVNPLLAGFQGGAGGFLTGLQIKGGLDSLEPDPLPRPPGPYPGGAYGKGPHR